MFITENTSRWSHQPEPDRTYWEAVEIDGDCRIYLAHPPRSKSDELREFLISTPSMLHAALAHDCFGPIDELYRIHRYPVVGTHGWVIQRVTKVLRFELEILGGLEALQIELESGQRSWVHPISPIQVKQRGEVIWQTPVQG